MKKGVEKKELIKSLEATLKLTRSGSGVLRLVLEDENTVIIHFDNGYSKAVNITGDSGVAIIYDVVKGATN